MRFAVILVIILCIQASAGGDTLIFNDGKVLKGKVHRMESDSVIFTQEEADAAVRIPRDALRTLTLDSDGRQFVMEGAASGADNNPAGERVPGFHRSIVRAAVFISFHDHGSSLFIGEKRNLEQYQFHLLTSQTLPYGNPYNLFVVDWSWGADIDLMPPAIEFPQTGSFSFTGVKFGLRGRYGCDLFDTYMYRESLGDIPTERRYMGRYMDFSYLGAGPVIDFIFSPMKNNAGMIIQVFFLYGVITNGRLRPNASLRDARILVSAPDYSMSVGGYTIRYGIGPHIVLNRWIPVTIGINITMATTRLRLPRPVISYWSGNTGPFVRNNFGLEFTLGFHI